MSHRVCPWWLGYLLASPLRRLIQDPAKVLGPYVREGMTVLEPGPGMGFFTLELARLVGPTGRVLAVDIQPRMLAWLRRRAARAGLADRVDIRLVPPDTLGLADLAGSVDFTLAMAVVHELPDVRAVFHGGRRGFEDWRRAPRCRAGRPRKDGGFRGTASGCNPRRVRDGRTAVDSPQPRGLLEQSVSRLNSNQATGMNTSRRLGETDSAQILVSALLASPLWYN